MIYQRDLLTYSAYIRAACLGQLPQVSLQAISTPDATETDRVKTEQTLPGNLAGHPLQMVKQGYSGAGWQDQPAGQPQLRL